METEKLYYQDPFLQTFTAAYNNNGIRIFGIVIYYTIKPGFQTFGRFFAMYARTQHNNRIFFICDII